MNAVRFCESEDQQQETIGLALVVKADSAKELDDLVTSLPVWPRMETAITPLTTFEDRVLSIERRLGDSRDKRPAP